MIEGWDEKLLDQRNLREVFLISNKIIPKSAGNRIFVTSITLVALFSYLASWYVNIFNIQNSYKIVHNALDIGFVLSISVLGFLVAGFSIFASITKPKLFILLAKLPYKKSDISNFQYVFFIFLNVFSVYIILLTISLFLKIGFSENSPLTMISYEIYNKLPNVCMLVNAIVFTVLIGLIAEAIVRLKSFTWNLYQAVILVIATDNHLKDG